MSEKHIWEFFWERIGNAFGVAGLMGNLCAESALRPNNLQNSYGKFFGMTDEEYTEIVDNGAYPKDAFIHDGAGYGLAQWTYWSRKQELYDYAKTEGKSIGDLDMQLNFLWRELGKYKSVISVLLSATSVRQASDAVLLQYEKPADLSEENQRTRAEYGMRYYERYAVMRRQLTIYKRLFYNSDCYKSGETITPMGVQVHSTGANNPYLKRYVQPDDGRLGNNPNGNSHNRPGGNVCASAYIGRLQDGTVAVYQALPWNQRCWLSGSGSNGNANRLGYLGFEICEDGLTDESYFSEAVLDKAVLLTAYWCQEFNIDPDAAVRDHSELHGMGLASNHSDITAWLKKFGRTMDGFRAAVKQALEDGIEVTYVDCDEAQVLYYAKAVNPGTYLNMRSGKGTMYAVVGKIPQGETTGVIDDSDAEWWKVTFKGITGYAMSQYLERVPDEDPEEDPAEEPKILPEYIKIPLPLALQLYDCLKTQIGDD